MPKRILVTGSRDWTSLAIVITNLCIAAEGDPDVTLVHGACPTGADSIAQIYAERQGWTIERHPAQWENGRKAGPARNRLMASLGADICLAFIRNHSAGASGCAAAAEAASIRTLRFEINEHSEPKAKAT
jgi:hypothetical protein